MSDRKRMAVVPEGGRTAVTRARVLERFGDPARPRAALVECRLETGRTHQIRVHLAYVGHPLVGDAVYGRRRRGADPALGGRFRGRRCTRRSLGFVHPRQRRGDALRGPGCRPISRICSTDCGGRWNETDRFHVP